ncbi:MAG: DUF1292 domain-containing protein [Clostridiales bacterium]|nr:DUF1292 domain-containing protein [Clostridiales bacterium]
MKSNKRSGVLGKKPSSGKKPERISDNRDNELIVIRDPYSRKDYYLSVIDTFVMSKHEYVVMYNYVPDDGSHVDPELVIMRTEFSKTGDQYFYSIKDSIELETAFVCFMRRYYGSVKPGVKVKGSAVG